MGGFGSGRWQRRKSTVEESLSLAMRDLGGPVHSHSSGGVVTWKWSSGDKSSIGYVVSWGDAPKVTLDYRWNDADVVHLPIRLQATPTQFGGQRQWFTCPLVIGGVACNRRVGKIYLPPGAKYFGCRNCHSLTYRSSQEAHRAERGTGTIEWARRWLDALKRRGRVKQDDPAGVVGRPPDEPSG